MRLELACLGALHLEADLFDVGEGHHVLVQRLGREHLPQAVADGGIDDLEELGLDIGLVAIADCLDKQVLQRLSRENLSEHVVDPAVKGLALVFELLQ